MSVFELEISDACDGCGECVSSCPLDVIENENGSFRIGIGCNMCGACAAVCPRGAIKKKSIKEDLEWVRSR